MKKYFSLLLIAVMALFVVSCTDETTNNGPYEDNDTYAVMYDITDNFSNATGDYIISRTFNTPIPASDVVLVYRKSGTDAGNTVWQQIPRTLFLDQGELDYDFDFTRNDVQLYANGTIDLAAQSQEFKNMYLNSQTFRIVIVPAAAGKSAVDHSDYDAVIRHYGIDDSQVKSL